MVNRELTKGRAAIRKMLHRGSLDHIYCKKGLATSAAPTTCRNGDASSRNSDAKTRRFNRRNVTSCTLEIEGEAMPGSGICPNKNSSFMLFQRGDLVRTEGNYLKPSAAQSSQYCNFCKLLTVHNIQRVVSSCISFVHRRFYCKSGCIA
uniref:Ovule protein n=1 Tax=Parascaris univalens TaxID=6257 RepID=A0A915CGM4_PARUN